MKESSKYRMPVGMVTNELQLRQLQKQLLKQQYQKSQNKHIFSPQPSPTLPSRRFSLQSLPNPESQPERAPLIARNQKQDEMRRYLTLELRGQMAENQQRRRAQLSRKMEEERAANQRNREIVSKELEVSRNIREKIREEMARDYEEKIRRKEEEKINQMNEKQKIKARLQSIQQAQSTKKHQKPSNQALLHQMSLSPKAPDYYKELASYQNSNYKNYEQKVKLAADTQSRNYDHIIQQRIEENRRREQEFQRYQREQRQGRREELQKVLEEQIRESQKKKLEQKMYDKAKFYGSRFEGVYHPIGNPVDSKFCKDNKYIIGELQNQAEKRRSRESVQPNNGKLYQGEGSSLARKGSLSLL